MAQYTFVAPPVLRYVLTHPDDMGGFMLVYKKWNEQHEQRRVRYCSYIKISIDRVSETSRRTIGLYDDAHSGTADSALGMISEPFPPSLIPARHTE